MAIDATQSLDYTTLITNVGVFLAAVGSVIVGIWSAVKKIKNATVVSESRGHGHGHIAGGLVVDHSTVLLWSESNRDVVQALNTHAREMMELRFAMIQLTNGLSHKS